jgi:hypothetical protein
MGMIYREAGAVFVQNWKRYTDKKEKEILPIYKEIQSVKWSSCKVIYKEVLPNI